jgi:hypothetical protein
MRIRLPIYAFVVLAALAVAGCSSGGTSSGKTTAASGGGAKKASQACPDKLVTVYTTSDTEKLSALSGQPTWPAELSPASKLTSSCVFAGKGEAVFDPTVAKSPRFNTTETVAIYIGLDKAAMDTLIDSVRQKGPGWTERTYEKDYLGDDARSGQWNWIDPKGAPYDPKVATKSIDVLAQSPIGDLYAKVTGLDAKGTLLTLTYTTATPK